MDESILTSIKQLLGIGDDTSFDSEIILHINSVFSILDRIAPGFPKGFRINDSTAQWSSYLTGDSHLDLVKTYMYMKVRLVFDPPTNSSLLSSLKESISEYEWRINDISESSEEVNI